MGAVGAAKAAEEIEDQVYLGACRSNCHCGCPIDVRVRDGKIVRTSAHPMPDARFSRICSKGLTNLYRTYSEQRVQYPMKRAGERGEDKWERISWDQAIEEIAGKIKQVQTESGPTAFAMMFDGSGNYGIASGTNSPSYSYRFLNATGATGIIEDVDRGMIPMYGPVIPFSKFYELLDQKTWNGEPWDVRVFYCYCCDMLSNMSNRNRNIELLDKLEMFVVADPFMTDTARYADYVLPSSFWFEQEDMYLTAQHSHPYAMYNEKAIEPLYESKPDFEIFNLLFDALDLSECKVETPREWFEMALDDDANRAAGVTPEVLYRDKVVRNYFPAEFSEAEGVLTWVCEKEMLVHVVLRGPGVGCVLRRAATVPVDDGEANTENAS